MDSFQDKIGWKRMRKRENKNYRSVPSLPDAFQKILKKQQKNCKKKKKNPLRLHLKPKQVGKGREREKIKILVPFRSYPTGNRKFQKNQEKNSKLPIWLHFKPKQVGKVREREKIKIFVPFCSVPTRRAIQNSKKIGKKFKKIKKHHYGFISSRSCL